MVLHIEATHWHYCDYPTSANLGRRLLRLLWLLHLASSFHCSWVKDKYISISHFSQLTKSDLCVISPPINGDRDQFRWRFFRNVALYLLPKYKFRKPRPFINIYLMIHKRGVHEVKNLYYILIYYMNVILKNPNEIIA